MHGQSVTYLVCLFQLIFPRWPCPLPQTFRDAGQRQRRRGQETWVQVCTWPLCNLHHVTECADKEWRGRIGFCLSLTQLCFYEPYVCTAMTRRWDALQSLGYAIAVRKKCHGLLLWAVATTSGAQRIQGISQLAGPSLNSELPGVGCQGRVSRCCPSLLNC